MTARPKIVVLDDDPTGSQTVHGCLLLMRWDVETLRMGLRDESPLFFVLTNTRSLTPGQAASVTRDVCIRLQEAIAAEGVEDFMVVSRSDSTLRGHYPIETDVISDEIGPFDAHFLVPAFFEGGRFTRDSVHYLMSDGSAVPVHETEFANDSVFAYSYSYLPEYVEEKTHGRIMADNVERIVLEDLRNGVRDRLAALEHNQCVVVDGETQEDLDAFARDALTVASQGKKFLFRSAASVLTSLAELPLQPIAPDSMFHYVRGGKPGVAIVGSHVQKTTQQLSRLLEEPTVEGVEVDVNLLLEDLQTGLHDRRKELLTDTLATIRAAYAEGKTPVVFTSRDELTFEDVQTRLEFGTLVSSFLMDVVRGLPSDIGFLISKGGITSNDVLSRGLRLRTARLLGQILAGCSVVRTPNDHPDFPNLPVVLFPGNVGNRDALSEVYRRLSQA
ncbi:MAG: four-carbon acid sugar kinase family protein [Cyanobacteria bacterium P01_A01_bin.3]